MKLLHIADLHLGKRISEYSLFEDQAHILGEIEKIAAAERPDAVLIAGDVYDRAAPAAEAVAMLDGFLSRLTENGVTVLMISGNHDSAERLAFGASMLKTGGLYVSPVYGGNVVPVTLNDAYGPVRFWLLPFLRPSQVRNAFPEEQESIESWTDAVRTAVSHMAIDARERNVLLAHQFVAGAERSESEDVSFVGGLDCVDAAVFDPFDYAALGHLHRPQRAGRETVRYAGTPLKYSFSEKNDVKSASVIELFEKGRVTVRTVPLKPLRDMRELRGSFDELMTAGYRAGAEAGDWLRVILTDEEDVPNALSRLRTAYPNVMRLEYDNLRTAAAFDGSAAGAPERKTPQELFAAFYEKMNGAPMSETQRSIVERLLKKAGGERE